MNKYKSWLVRYEGGGYDGCIWEWNFFFFDKDGNFHDIFSSGCAGISDKHKAKDLLDDKFADEENPNSRVYVYDVTGDCGIEEFCKKNAPELVRSVATWFDVHCPEVDFFVVCTDCGQHEQVDETRLEGWHGCGGTMSTTGHLLCRDCYATGLCDCCNEWVGKDSIINMNRDSEAERKELELIHEGGKEAGKKFVAEGIYMVCEYCFEDACDQNT